MDSFVVSTVVQSQCIREEKYERIRMSYYDFSITNFLGL